MKNKTRILFSFALAVLMAAAVVCQDSAAISVENYQSSGYSGTLAAARTKKDIVEKWLAYDKADAVKIFDENPAVKAPYQTGKLNASFIDQAKLYFRRRRYQSFLFHPYF